MRTYPETRSSELTEILHGEQVVDPYRWLEDSSNSETIAWTEQQNALTHAYLSAFPGRERIRQRLSELLAIGVLSTPTPVKGRYFYLRREGQQNHPVLYWRLGRGGADHVAIAPNALNAAGTTALDWYFPSVDGRLLAFGLSENGSEESLLHLLDLDTGTLLPERIPRMRAASVAWLPNSTGFYYTRYPAPGEVPAEEEQYHRAIYFHRLGEDPSGDQQIFKPAEKEHWPGVSLSPDGRWLVVSVARTFDQTDLYIQDLSSGAEMVPVARDLPASFDGEIAHGRLFMRTNLDAPTHRLYLLAP